MRGDIYLNKQKLRNVFKKTGIVIHDANLIFVWNMFELIQLYI